MSARIKEQRTQLLAAHAVREIRQRCKDCGSEMQDFFRSLVCPKECDLPPERRTKTKDGFIPGLKWTCRRGKHWQAMLHFGEKTITFQKDDRFWYTSRQSRDSEKIRASSLVLDPKIGPDDEPWDDERDRKDGPGSGGDGPGSGGGMRKSYDFKISGTEAVWQIREIKN